MPISPAQRCVTLPSEPGDVVLDPYAGSGTTLLAAAQLRRRWVGIERTAEFVQPAPHNRITVNRQLADRTGRL